MTKDLAPKEATEAVSPDSAAVGDCTPTQRQSSTRPPESFPPLTQVQIKQFFQSAPFAVAVFDADMRYLLASRKWKTDYAMEGQNLIGRSHFDFFPKMSDAWRDRFQQCLQGQRFDDQLNPFTKSDGSTEWIRWNLHPWTDETGAVCGVLLFTEFVSQQKQKELEVERNQQFLQAVLESVQDSIIACDADGEITLLNAAAREMMDWADFVPGAGFTGQGYDLYEPDGRTEVPSRQRPLARALRGESVDREELVLKRKDELTRRVLAQARPMVDREGQRLGAVLSISDITEEARVAQELKEREERYRTLYNNTPVMLHSVDTKGRLLRVSDYWLEKLGYQRAEVIGQYFHDFLTPDSKAYVRDQMHPEFFKTGHVMNVDIKISKKNGDLIDVLLSKSAEYDDEGRIVSSLTVLTDVTERKRMERALRRSESQFRGAFETSPQGMALLSFHGRWLTANDAMCSMFGYTPEEFRSLKPDTLLPDGDGDPEFFHFKELVAGEQEADQVEKKFVHKDGSEVWALVTGILVRGPQGEPEHFVVQMLDLTARKHTEAQLLQAQKLEAVGQLTGGLAHDFNNLLGVIMLSFQLLERLHDDEATAKRIKTGLDATRRGADLTQRMLAFSRRQALEQNLTDIAGLVDGMHDMLERTLGRTIEIKTDIAEQLWPVMIDQHQLESSLLNLAINARDAMPDGGVLTIEARNTELDENYAESHTEVTAGPYVQISVTDTGVGIKQEFISKVFQPFFTTKEVGKGTGLGLSMVYGFIKQSKGHTEIYSEEGQGTSVKLYIPASAKVWPEQMGEGGNAAKNLPGGSETILVVDDDPDVREVTVSLIEGAGYSVIEAEDGRSALNVLQSGQTVDLVFSDIVMPGGVDGIALAEEIRKLHPDVKVLLTTGFAEAATKNNRMSKISADIIGKPYPAEDLMNKLREMLDEG